MINSEVTAAIQARGDILDKVWVAETDKKEKGQEIDMG